VGILEESLTLSRELGDRMNCVAALGSLGRLTAQMGDLVTSLAWFEQTLQLAREIGDLRPLAITLLNMGDLESQLGRLAHAEARLDEARALAEELGDSYTLSHALETLAGVQRERGRAEEARANLRESMRMASELGGLSLILILLGEFAGQAIAEGDPTRAARLEGAEEALRERLGIPRSAEDQSARAATHRQVRAMLDEHALSLARGLGAGMSLEEAVAYALGESTEAGKGRRHADAGGSLRD
jgi:tetratricopeptide (TPR) repeat protein